MARKKKMSPLATIITIAGVGFVGWGVYRFLIKPMIDKKKALINTTNDGVIDAEYQDVTNQNVG